MVVAGEGTAENQNRAVNEEQPPTTNVSSIGSDQIRTWRQQPTKNKECSKTKKKQQINNIKTAKEIRPLHKTEAPAESKQLEEHIEAASEIHSPANGGQI